jgi:hypothetical protein
MLGWWSVIWGSLLLLGFVLPVGRGKTVGAGCLALTRAQPVGPEWRKL